MKFETNDRPKTYAVSGAELRINFDVKEVEREDMITKQKRLVFVGEEVVVPKGAPTSTIIEAIIASRYSVGAEVAMLRSADTDPAKVEYLAFVQLAKALGRGASQ